MDKDEVYKSLVFWQDDSGDGWLVSLYWASIDDRWECVGFELRSWCDDIEAFYAHDARAKDLVDNPRRLVWSHLGRDFPLPTLVARERGAMAASAIERANETAAWFRSHHDRATAQDVLRQAAARAEQWSKAGCSGRKRLTERDWQLIVDVAEDAEREGVSKARAVAAAFGIEQPTRLDLDRMRQRIRRARRKQTEAGGILPSEDVDNDRRET